ncbi:MAG: hypothetical protein RL367_2914 [Pseudomonadota bacterium]
MRLIKKCATLAPLLQEFRVGLPPTVQVQSGGLDDPKLGWGGACQPKACGSETGMGLRRTPPSPWLRRPSPPSGGAGRRAAPGRGGRPPEAQGREIWVRTGVAINRQAVVEIQAFASPTAEQN